MTHTKALARLLRALDVAADDGTGHLAPWADWNNGNGDACGPELDAAIAEARAALGALQSAQPAQTGGSPEHMLQDHSRELSRWLADKPDARLHAREAAAAIAAQPSAPSAEPAERTLLEQYDREQLPGYRAGYEDGRQRGYTVGHRHGLEQTAAYATAPAQEDREAREAPAP